MPPPSLCRPLSLPPYPWVIIILSSAVSPARLWVLENSNGVLFYFGNLTTFSPSLILPVYFMYLLFIFWIGKTLFQLKIQRLQNSDRREQNEKFAWRLSLVYWAVSLLRGYPSTRYKYFNRSRIQHTVPLLYYTQGLLCPLVCAPPCLTMYILHEVFRYQYTKSFLIFWLQGFTFPLWTYHNLTNDYSVVSNLFLNKNDFT